MALNIIELFSGVGTFSMALRDLGVPFRLMDSVEIDPYAVKAFNAIHGTSYEPQDIRKWDKDIEVDMVCHGSPCTNFSAAGRGEGGDKDSGTASSLMWETVRIVEKLKPKYVCWENVKNLLSKKHRHNFDKYIEALDELGYSSYYKILNAKEYGVPQNRERVFTVSIRKDVDEGFVFPDPIPLTKKLGDVLEKDVDEKYYLSEAQAKNLTYKETGNVEAILDIKGRDCIKKVYRKSGVAPTLTTMQGGNRQPKIIDDTYGYDEKPREYSDASPTLRAGRQGLKVEDRSRVRRLTPKECWRLMSYSDIDFDKAKKAGLSDIRLYKLAGNGIVLDVAKALLKELLDA